MPALSCPRCCSAYRPRYVRLAASGWPKIPKTPHSSRNLSNIRPFCALTTTQCTGFTQWPDGARSSSLDRPSTQIALRLAAERLVDRRARPSTDDPDAIAADAPDHVRRARRPPRQAPAARRRRLRLTDTTTRDADSPNSVAMSRNAADRRRDTPPRRRRRRRPVSKQHSASVTREAAFGAVVRRPDESRRPRPRPAAAAAPPRAARSSAGGTPRIRPCIDLQILAAAELAAALAEQHHDVAGRPERAAARPAPRPRSARRRRAPASAGRLAVGLVVEADVAAGDRDVERPAGRAHALDRARELPHDLGPLRVAEVEAVGRADRQAAGAGDVARASATASCAPTNGSR